MNRFQDFTVENTPYLTPIDRRTIMNGLVAGLKYIHVVENNFYGIGSDKILKSPTHCYNKTQNRFILVKAI